MPSSTCARCNPPDRDFFLLHAFPRPRARGEFQCLGSLSTALSATALLMREPGLRAPGTWCRRQGCETRETGSMGAGRSIWSFFFGKRARSRRISRLPSPRAHFSRAPSLFKRHPRAATSECPSVSARRPRPRPRPLLASCPAWGCRGRAGNRCSARSPPPWAPRRRRSR